MTNKFVKEWFGDEFYKLSPELQQLHLHGGILKGNVEVILGKGFSGVNRKQIIKKVKYSRSRYK